jgi:hypothetical protein
MPTPSVVRVTQLGSPTGSVSTGKTTTGQETIKFRVKFDGTGSTLIDALNATTVSDGSVPPFGDARGVLILTGKDGSQLGEDSRLWDVTCTYTLPQPGEEQKPDDGRTRWAINISFSSQPYEKEIQFNPADGKPILNAAHDPISGVMDTESDEVLNVAFTSESGLFDVIDATKGTVNDADLTLTINGEEVVYPAGTLKFLDYTREYVLDASQEIYPRLTLRFLYRTDGWVRGIANKGFRKLVSGVPTWIKDDDGRDITEPVYLTADGTAKLASGSVVNTIDLDPIESDFTDLLAGVQT